jgi:hypothetical protein
VRCTITYVTSTAIGIQGASGDETDGCGVQYERYDLEDPDRWVLYVSPSDEPVMGLVVFVHGFGGKTVGTWLDFPVMDLANPENRWWREADLLFVGYESMRDSITAVANRNIDVVQRPTHRCLTY